MCNFCTAAPDSFPYTTLVDSMDFSDEGDSYGCRLRGYVIAPDAKGSGVSFRSSLIFREPGPVFATTPAGPVARNGSPCSHAQGWPPDGLHGRERDRRLLVFNACFAGYGLVPLLPAGHHQANREFPILKLTPVSRFGRGPHLQALANETEFRLPHPFPKRCANFGNERPKPATEKK